MAETAGMRVKRVWLSGPKAGTVDVLLDNLPGCAGNSIRSKLPSVLRWQGNAAASKPTVIDAGPNK